jgi:hypothetical protein
MTDTPQQLPIEILHRHTGVVLYRASRPGLSMRETVVEAVAAKADLSDSDLSCSNLRGTDLSCSNLSGSDLSCSNLRGTDLRGSDLSCSNLSGSNLSGSDLRGSNLSGSNLSCSNLSCSNLSGSNLRGSNGEKITLHAKSRVAYAGPVGNSDRIVHGFLAEPDAQHKKPWLVLCCGCFTGDEAAYRKRVEKNYGEKEGAHHLAQCLAALRCIKAIAATWTKGNK